MHVPVHILTCTGYQTACPHTSMCRTLDAELEPLLLSKAAQFHLPGEWVSRLDKLDPERRQVSERGRMMGTSQLTSGMRMTHSNWYASC